MKKTKRAAGPQRSGEPAHSNGVRTVLHCAGCNNAQTTDAFDYSGWPAGWHIEAGKVWHNRYCRQEFVRREQHRASLVSAVEALDKGASTRLVQLARQTLGDSSSRTGAKADLARLVLALVGPERQS